MRQAFKRYSWHTIRCSLLLFSIAVTWNASSAILDIYNIEWYSVHFENSAAARFYTSSILLLIMCIFCFPWIRYIGTGAGLWGAALMTIKLWNQPFIKDGAMEATGQWPTYSVVTGIRAFCILLIFVSLIWPSLIFRIYTFFLKKNHK